MPEIRRRRRMRHLVKRKMVVFKIRKDQPKKKAVVQQDPSEVEIELRQQNGHLAFALNESKEENARILSHVNDLNGEIIELRGQIAELNAAREEERRNFEEGEFHRRLAEYMEPQKAALNKALDHVVGLSQHLEAAMKMASAPGRRSKQSFPSSANRSLPPQSPKLQNGPMNRKNTTVAQVAPMVKGHGIHKPNVRITRLNLEDLNMLTRPRQRNEDDANEQNDSNENDENAGDTEMNDAAVRDGNNDADVDDDDDDEIELSVQRPRRRNREPEPPALEPVIEESEGDEEEEEEEDEDEDNLAGSTVLLLPRLVLERVTISPTKNGQRRSSSQVGRRSTMSSTVNRRSTSGPADFLLPRQRRSVANDHGAVAGAEETSEDSPVNGHEASDLDSGWTESPESASRRPPPSRKVSFQFEGANLSPVQAPEPARKRGRSSILKKELKIVVADFRKSSEFSGRSEGALANGPSAQAAANDNEASGSVPGNEDSASPVHSNDEEEMLMEEMFPFDPIEGPSWLLDTNTRRRGQKSRATKSTKTPKPEAEPSKPVPAVDPPTSVVQNEGASADVVQDDVVSQSSSRSVGSSSVATAAAASSSTSRVTEGDLETTGNGCRISDEQSAQDGGRPSKRRAASAVASFKEPSLNKKLRQGDDLNKDIKFKESKTTKKK